MATEIDSKFRFVLLAAERAEQILRGAPPRLDLPGHKPSRVAVDEVQASLVEWDYGSAADAPEPAAAPDAKEAASKDGE